MQNSSAPIVFGRGRLRSRISLWMVSHALIQSVIPPKMIAL
jgi:hypothetical protein